MQQILICVLGYLILVIAWGIICVVIYAFSLATKSKKPIQFVSSITQIIQQIFYFIVFMHRESFFLYQRQIEALP
jgi:hypothetical protein